MEIKNINEIKAKTYSWLKVNSKDIEIEDVNLNKEYDVQISPFRKINKNGYQFSTSEDICLNFKKDILSFKLPNDLKFGASNELKEQVYSKNNSNFSIVINENEKVSKPIVIDYTLDNNNNVLIDLGYIKAKKNSSSVIVLNYKSIKNNVKYVEKPNILEEDLNTHYRNSMLHIVAEENAYVKVVKLQNLNDSAVSIDSNVSIFSEKSNVELVTILLGGKISCENYKNYLNNEDASVNLKTAYMGVKNSVIDLDYEILANAKYTVGNIYSRGVLMDNSKKTFKGTLDFKKGCTSSKLTEEEKVLLLSDRAVSYAVPLLLCAEDDVEGAHAASSGKIDTEQLFYLTSRGLSKKESEKIIVHGYLNEILENIDCIKTKEEVIEKINRRLG